MKEVITGAQAISELEKMARLVQAFAHVKDVIEAVAVAEDSMKYHQRAAEEAKAQLASVKADIENAKPVAENIVAEANKRAEKIVKAAADEAEKVKAKSKEVLEGIAKAEEEAAAKLAEIKKDVAAAEAALTEKKKAHDSLEAKIESFKSKLAAMINVGE